jgi:hypothetical protein
MNWDNCVIALLKKESIELKSCVKIMGALIQEGINAFLVEVIKLSGQIG